MLIALGILAGSILGAAAAGFQGALAGGFTGLIIALAIRSHNELKAREARVAAVPDVLTTPDVPTTAPDLPPIASASTLSSPVVRTMLTVPERLSAIEARLARLEAGMVAVTPADADAATLIREGVLAVPPFGAPVVAGTPVMADMASTLSAPTAGPTIAPVNAESGGEKGPPGFARTSDGTFVPVAAAHAATARAASAAAAPTLASERLADPRAVNPLWAWVTGGNLLTRIGVVILFIGVVFLLRYFAEMITISIELKLAGVALAGAALVIVGMRLTGTRPGYGVSLAGAGAGILYLTTYAALRLYDVLPPELAFVVFVTIALLTVGLAMRSDAQPLAGLAIAGGFLAPFLLSTGEPTPLTLFSYFAVLNAAIFALAWVRSWRALNVLGFVFTFMLGLFWGHRFYRPEYFATVQPFLVLYFLFYVAIAVLYAVRAPLRTRAPVDGLLVFGVPLIGFALQTGLVRDHRYGAAISAFALAAFYGVLAAGLFRRKEPGLGLLGRAFLVLAVIFVTVAIPYAADARWTSAWWALEAAGVYWIGCRQQQSLARACALLLQLGAAVAFASDLVRESDHIFLNANFLGSTLIAVAALVTAWLADHHRDRVSSFESKWVPFMLLWGLVWWYGGAAREMVVALPARAVPNAMLAFVTGTVALPLILRHWLRWPQLARFGVALLPAMALVGMQDWERMHTTLRAWGFVVWPLAWIVHWCVLHEADARRLDEAKTDTPPQPGAAWLQHAHTASAIALVAWISWEASEWVGRWFAEGTVWIACAAAWPAIAYLALAPRLGAWRGWPWADYRDAYAVSAATAIAALLAVWFVLVNLVSPGSAAPLPYVPLANPLDFTLIAALLVLFAWTRATDVLDEVNAYRWFGVAVFLLVNAVVFRAVHQWLDVPWRWSALLRSTTLQATLTLMWTATALPLMVTANKRAIRPLWMVGATLLAVVVGKLFLLDLAALSGLSRVVAFLGVGVLLLVIGYLAPLPPAARRGDSKA